MCMYTCILLPPFLRKGNIFTISYIFIYTCMYMHTHMYTCVYKYITIYINIVTRNHTNACTCHPWQVRVFVEGNTYTILYTYIFIYACTYTHIHIRVRMNIYKHININKHNHTNTCTCHPCGRAPSTGSAAGQNSQKLVVQTFNI